jgi:hypothetical protein
LRLGRTARLDSGVGRYAAATKGGLATNRLGNNHQLGVRRTSLKIEIRNRRISEGRSNPWILLAALRMHEHLVPLLDTIGEALAGRPASFRLTLSIEETDPFGVEWTAVGDTGAVARLVRADTEAVLIVVTDTNGSIDAAAMRSLHAQLQGDYTGSGLYAAFDWLLGEGPPLAALHIAVASRRSGSTRWRCVWRQHLGRTVRIDQYGQLTFRKDHSDD